MPDTIAPETIKREAFSFGNKEVAPPTDINTKQKNATDRSNFLVRERNSGKTAKELIEGNSIGYERLSQTTSESIVAGISGGKGKLDSNGKATIDNPSAQEREHFDKAKERVDKIISVIEYTQIAKEAQRDGKDPNSINSNFSTIREAALEAILSDGQISSRYQDELQGLTPQQQKEYIDACIVTDPEFNKILIKSMEQIEKDVSELTSVAESKENKDLADKKTRLESEIEATYNVIFRNVEININTPIGMQIKTLVEDYIKSGAKPSEIQDLIKNELLRTRQIKDPYVYEVYYTAVQQRESYEADKESMSTEIDRLNNDINATNNRQLQNELINQLSRKRKELDATSAKLSEAIGNIKQIKQSLGLNDATINANAMYVHQLNDKIYGQPAADGSHRGGIIEATSRLYEKAKELSETNGRISSSDFSEEITKKRAERSKKEEEALGQLEGVLANSITALLTNRADSIQNIERERLAKAEAEAKKQGDKWREEKIKKYRDVEEKRWVKFDPNKRKNVYDTQVIARDKKTYFIYGDEGVRRYIADRIGFRLDETAEKNAIARSIGGKGTTTAYDALDSDKKAQADAIYQDRVKQFDQLYGELAEITKQKFMTDLMAARSGNMISRMGELSITNGEWQQLENNYGKMLDTALEQSKAGREAVKRLKDQGIMPSFKMKWLLWALLAAGVGVAGVGAIGAAGIGIPSIAGAVASGAGGAIKTGFTE